MSPSTSAPAPAPALGRKAKHCAELLGVTPSIEELVPALSLLGEKLARVLPAAFSRLNGGEPPQVRIGMPMDCTLGSIAGDIEGLASHGLLGLGPQGLPIVTTFEAGAVLRLVDRAFGGRGVAPDPLPETLPLSADLLLGRLEEAVATALGEAFSQAGGGEDLQVSPLRRDTSLRQLNPCDKRADLLQISIDVEEEGLEPWTFALAFAQETLAAALVPARRARPPRARRAAPAPTDEPFADLPLEVTAVLVDMTMPFSRLSALKPGDVIPVAVARSVPLQVTGSSATGTGIAKTIATGTVGEVEDRVAVQLATAFAN